MKRILLTVAILFAAVFVSLPLYAQESVTRDIDISVTLDRDGGADICEVWDMSIYRGTEWYLVRENLGDISISGLSVCDETGREFIFEGEWEVERSLNEKAGRCGIVTKRNGCELCWGLGSHGDHIFTVRYHMSHVVKSFEDYDALHLQFVSSGISPLPRNAKVTVSIPGVALNDTIARIWTFGFDGTDRFEQGSAVVRTIAPFTSDRHSMIVLLRFDKGIFSPSSTASGLFQEHLDRAFEGSAYKDYQDDERSARMVFITMLVFMLLGLAIIILAVAIHIWNRNLKLFGVKKLKEIGWIRTIPFNGNLEETAYVLGRVNRLGAEANICSAIILQMIKNSILTVSRDKKGVLLVFNDKADLSSLSEWQRKFYNMLREASGEDLVLQEKEFSRWSKKHSKLVSDWLISRKGAGVIALQSDGYVNGQAFTPDFQQHARASIGFRKFLKDFTLISERGTEEVTLWQDYIIFGALFGIADKIAKELKDIDPKMFEEYVGYDYATMGHVLYFSNRMGHCAVNAVAFQQTSSSVGGHGGFSSFGGGGGFSGGGHGGGAR